MGAKVNYWKDNFIKIIAVIFAVFGALSVIFPLPEITEGNILERVLLFGVLIIVLFIVSLFSTNWNINKNSVCVFSQGKSKVIFEYNDFEKILNNVSNSSENYTIVVPVNTCITYVFNNSMVKAKTIHRLSLDYLFEKTGKTLDIEETIKKTSVKRGEYCFTNGECVGKIGDWFLITPEVLGIDSKVRFLFLEVFDIEEKNGVKKNSELNKEQYLFCIQSLLEAIPDVLSPEECVYIPLIGAGAGNVGKPGDIMQFMEALLRFNKNKIRQEIHVVIREEDREDAPIYQLSKF